MIRKLKLLLGQLDSVVVFLKLLELELVLVLACVARIVDNNFFIMFKVLAIFFAIYELLDIPMPFMLGIPTHLFVNTSVKCPAEPVQMSICKTSFTDQKLFIVLFFIKNKCDLPSKAIESTVSGILLAIENVEILLV